MPHITFVHGISNKPAPGPLHDLWLRALARDNGLDCSTEGITSSMVYWADVMYPKPEANVESLEAANDMLEAERAAMPAGGSASETWRDQLPASERAFVDALSERLGADVPLDGAETIGASGGIVTTSLTAKEMEAVVVLERIPLPWFIKGPLMKLLLRDVHHYLFNAKHSPRAGTWYKVQDEIRGRFIAAANEAPQGIRPHIVISHSMGTVIAYDCLKRVTECPMVDALVTIGSPLGLDEVQDKLSPEWTRGGGFPSKVHGPWVNVYDPLDPVAGFDPRFEGDYMRGGQKVVEDIKEENWGKWRHSITKYLHGAVLRRRLGELLA